jgi:hypothetical protein
MSSKSYLLFLRRANGTRLQVRKPEKQRKNGKMMKNKKELRYLHNPF